MLYGTLFSMLLAVSSASPDAALATKLAAAIANEQGFSAAYVYVGQLPPGFKTGAPLPQYTVIGSVVRHDREPMEGTEVTVYYEVPVDPHALDAYRLRLQKSGWRESRLLQQFAQLPEQKGGFIVEPRTPDLPAMYCKRGQGMISIEHSRATPGTVAVATMLSSESAAFCAIADTAMTDMAAGIPPLPALAAPAGITMEQRGAFGASKNSSNVTLATSRPINDVGSDFARQFDSAGWSADAPAQSASAYVQTFHVHENGHHYLATLSLVTNGRSGQYDGSVQERDVDSPTANVPFILPGMP